jgi:hypothetical protein
VVRLDQTSVKEQFESKSEGRIKEERETNLSLVEDVENDLHRLKMNRWRPRATNKELTSVIKEAKLLTGPQSQRTLYDPIENSYKILLSIFIRCL